MPFDLATAKGPGELCLPAAVSIIPEVAASMQVNLDL